MLLLSAVQSEALGPLFRCSAWLSQYAPSLCGVA